ncbi:MAG: hypothetical protein EA397_18925 [Deltaproteobacteria bacterium]|nr:MAG: hypothetical protein EA397_18925 [Deltaproteobacteria bacterium]
MAEPLLHLRDILPAHEAQVGGKASSLGRLAADGLPVPAGFVVPVSAFVEALRGAGLFNLASIVHQQGEGRAAAELRRRVADIELPAPLLQALVEAGRALGGPLAVRSSGVDEDGASRSYAGQHDSVLGVGPTQLVAAVRACWASLYSERALAYRGGRGPAPGSLAVLVQRMVPAEASGVLFTVNPVSGSWRELSIEAVWGLPEGLVSGQVAPQWFLLRRPRRTPRPVQRVLARVRLHHLQRDVHPQSRRWVLDDRGQVRVEPMPASLRDRAALSRHDARRLGRLGLRIEARMGRPQDIEWARTVDGQLWILQARPVTASSGRGREPQVLWTRRFIGERLPDPVTPLWWSIFSPTLEHFIAYPAIQRQLLGGGGAVRLVEGRAYLNVTVFQHLAFKLPGHPPPSFMLELLPPHEAQRLRSRFAVAPDLGVYAAFLRVSLAERRWERFAWNPFTNPRRWAAFEAEITRDLDRLSRPPIELDAAIAAVHELLELLRRYIGIHVCSLLFANLWDQIFEGLLVASVPEAASELRRALVVTPPGNRTLEVNQALSELATELTDDDLDALVEGRGLSGRGHRAMQAFLAAHGHRADASWDLFAPRWRDQPARLVPVLRARRREGSAMELSPEDYARARARLKEQVGDAASRAVLTGLLDLLREYLLLRENQRYRFEQLQWVLRLHLDAVGALLVERGLLDRVEDLRFCTWPEIQRLARRAPGAEPGQQERLARRRRRYQEQQGRRVPNFLRGDEGLVLPTDGKRLVGHGVSAGRAQGRVRLVRTLAEAGRLQPGEILVAPAVDPAWTPLLMVAGGMVLEMGSRLSHGAVVAREYRLPAVVNVDGALERLVDGEEVIIDGTRGIVFLQRGEAP